MGAYGVGKKVEQTGSGRRVGRGPPLWHPWSPPYYHSLFVLTRALSGIRPLNSLWKQPERFRALSSSLSPASGSRDEL